ncbi:MAG: 3-deoxy-8-phosphooctulonate synthase [Clostridiales bacterium]|nr:3-deoxy-8-phosphooctulonate synthase [Clostridiales bacterium]
MIKKLFFIAGPCVIESEEMVMRTASIIAEIAQQRGLDFYFKASIDKANRTSIDSFRGLGFEEGLRILDKVKTELGLKIATDIHEAAQAHLVAQVADIIQIPAFLCRQTDLVVAAAKTGKILNLKKGQFLAPWDMRNVVKKAVNSGNSNIIMCERGSFFGYNNLVVDMLSIPEMKKIGFPVIIDATHSLQKPGGNGTSSGGRIEYVESLSKAAIAAGADGLFMEVHPDPCKALSDGPNMVKLDDLGCLLDKLLRVFYAVNEE